MLNHSLFSKIQNSNSKILVVTKYWNDNDTQKIISEAEQNYPEIVFCFGENRIETNIEKDTPRSKLHFIGNIQSKKIKDIVKYCSCIHSLDSLKHAEKINTECEKQNLEIKVFLQIKLDPEKESGISASELESFISEIRKLSHIEIVGVSGMGAGEFNEQEKNQEFETLIHLRDKFLPGTLISAGTSRDYKIALDEGINVLRIGKKIII